MGGSQTARQTAAVAAEGSSLTRPTRAQIMLTYSRYSKALGVLFAIAVLASGACGSKSESSDAGCQTGGESCSCLSNGGCDDGLTCATNLNRCVRLAGTSTGGTTGSGGDGAGGTGTGGNGAGGTGSGVSSASGCQAGTTATEGHRRNLQRRQARQTLPVPAARRYPGGTTRHRWRAATGGTNEKGRRRNHRNRRHHVHWRHDRNRRDQRRSLHLELRPQLEQRRDHLLQLRPGDSKGRRLLELDLLPGISA